MLIATEVDELLKIGMLALLAGAGGFFGSYLKMKGENLATHEDINKLVDQVSAVTTATKNIEATISSEVWDKQKRWELKRDTLFEVTKRIAAVKDALFNMSVAYSFPSGNTKEPFFTERANQASQKCWEVESSFDQATLLVNLVCGEEVNRLLLTFAEIMRRCAKEISKQETDAANKSQIELRIQASAVTAAMRKEMGIDKSA
jgi:hypothetical protein